MRALSPFPGYSIQLIEARENIVLDARGYASTQVLDKPVIADFDTRGLADYEIEAALESFNFSGLPDGVNPLTRIASFDSEAYVERFPARERGDMLIQIDLRLEALSKLYPSEFIIVEPPRAECPWPTYDRDSVESILQIQERMDPEGTLAERIRKYEEENKNRPTLIQALQDVEDPDGAERRAEERVKARAEFEAKKVPASA